MHSVKFNRMKKSSVRYCVNNLHMTWYKEKSMSINYDEMRIYKDRIRIFFIIYFFAEKYNEIEHIDCTKVLRTEVKIQKLDFLIRNPDYLCYELLDICDRQDVNRDEIKAIINGEKPVKEILTEGDCDFV